MKKILVSSIIVLLAGCAQTSPQQHARHFALHLSESLNGNYQESHSYDYARNLPHFQEVYAQGKADRKAGRTAAYAQQYASAMKSQLMSGFSNETYLNAPQAGTVQKASSKADAQLYANEMAATYLDGFEGR